jgi:hypothetical protein
MKNLFIPIIILIITLYSCDKVDNPIAPTTNTTVNEEGRIILIEEFTGQLCTYCPDGAREIERLDSIYGEQLISVSFHAGPFASPGNGAPNDFTTTSGDSYFTTFGVSSNPAATVSRLNGATITGATQWESEINSIKDLDPEISIAFSTVYDSISREVNINVETEWLLKGDPSVNYKMQVFIIEDHITAYQLDNGNHINDYDHRHLFRGSVNGTWGTLLTEGSTVGTIETNQFNYTLDPTWVDNNCEIIVFVYKEGPDYEVIQANHLKIFPSSTINNSTD